MTPTQQGRQFEEQVMESAILRGFVAKPNPDRKGSYDLEIAGKRVQCKTKTVVKGRLSLHCTRPLMRNEFDVLAIKLRMAVDEEWSPVILVPVEDLPGSDTLLARTLLKTWFSKRPEYFENWEVFG